MKERLGKILIVLFLVVITISFCIVLNGCSNYDYLKDGAIKILLHPINTITGNEIKEGETIQIEESNLRNNYHWLTFEYEVEKEKKFISEDNNYLRRLQISYTELHHITTIYQENMNIKEYFKKWEKLSIPTGKGKHEIIVGFNERMMDDNKISFIPSKRFETAIFRFELEII